MSTLHLQEKPHFKTTDTEKHLQDMNGLQALPGIYSRNNSQVKKHC